MEDYIHIHTNMSVCMYVTQKPKLELCSIAEPFVGLYLKEIIKAQVEL